MDNLNDVLVQRANLEQQLSALRKKESRLKLENRSLVSVDEQVYVVKESNWYKLQLRQKAKGEVAEIADCCFPYIYSNSIEELENEMLNLIQKLIDATIQLRQHED